MDETPFEAVVHFHSRRAGLDKYGRPYTKASTSVTLEGGRRVERTVMAFGRQHEALDAVLRRTRSPVLNVCFNGGSVLVLGVPGDEPASDPIPAPAPAAPVAEAPERWPASIAFSDGRTVANMMRDGSLTITGIRMTTADGGAQDVWMTVPPHLSDAALAAIYSPKRRLDCEFEETPDGYRIASVAAAETPRAGRRRATTRA